MVTNDMVYFKRRWSFEPHFFRFYKCESQDWIHYHFAWFHLSIYKKYEQKLKELKEVKG